MSGRRIGYLLAEPAVPLPVLGSTIAELELLRALLRFSSASAVTVFAADPEAVLASPGLRAYRGRRRLQVRHRREIVDAVRSDRLDVLHTSFVQAWEALYAREAAGRPCVVTAVLHSIGYLDCRIPALKSLLLAPGGADAVVCPSRDAALALGAVAEDMARGTARPHRQSRSFRAVRIPHGVDERAFAPGDRLAARRTLRVPAGKMLLLYVGRLNPWNKMELLPLLVAVQRLVARGHRDVRLLLVGEEQLAGYRARLLRAARLMGIGRHVRAVPARREEMPQYYAAADVFVSPADNVQETFGLTLLEAMASGLPVVASGWDGYKDLILDGRNGYVVPTCGPLPDAGFTARELFIGSEPVLYHVAQTTAVNVDVLVDRLERLVSDHRLRGTMGRRARELVCRRYTWRRIAAAYDALWERALRRRRPRPRARRASLYMVDYARCFRHFGSSPFPATARVTPLGRAFVAEATPLAPQLMEMARWAGLDVGRLVDSLGRMERRPPRRVRWTPELAFALKHWLITTEDEWPSRHPN
jgi:glycosyltransferase involved in cell wall biosynthesis